MTDPSETQEAMLHRVLDTRKSWPEKNPKTMWLLLLLLLGFVSPSTSTLVSGYTNGKPHGMPREEVRRTVNQRVGTLETATVKLDEKVRISAESQQIEDRYQTELIEDLAIKNRIEPDAARKADVVRARNRATRALAKPIIPPDR